MELPQGQFDRKLLGIIERSIPLVRRPYEQIAAQLGASAREVLDRLAAMRGPGGVIREISGIFDAAALGYSQGLLALAVDDRKADQAGRTVSAHPGVSHCYRRSGPYAIWLTLATSPKSALGLEKTAARLASLAGAGSHMVLPTLKRYKLHVRFAAPAAEADEPQASGGGPPAEAPELTETQVRAVRGLQIDLPSQPDPFAIVGEKTGIDADDLLVCGADFLAAGWLRRYAAVLRYRPGENVLVAWCVEPHEADRAAAACAALPQVSHCYLRPPGPDWPYTLYAMIHADDRAACRRAIDEAEGLGGFGRRVELWTVGEFKKQRVPLLTDDEAAWEAEHLDDGWPVT